MLLDEVMLFCTGPILGTVVADCQHFLPGYVPRRDKSPYMWKVIKTWRPSLRKLKENIHYQETKIPKGTLWKFDGFCHTCFGALFARDTENEDSLLNLEGWSHVKVWDAKLQTAEDEENRTEYRKSGPSNTKEHDFYFHTARSWVEGEAKISGGTHRKSNDVNQAD